MKLYKNDGIENISGDTAQEISLEDALFLIEKLPTREEFDESFIGFINPMLKFHTIQFLRHKKNNWYVDVPVVENGFYAYSLIDDNLTTETVKIIIKKFFKGKDWMHLCNLKKQ